MNQPLIFIALGAIAALLLRSAWKRRRLKKRLARGVAAEGKAAELAQRHGYRIVQTQAPGQITMLVDGRRHEKTVRADLLLERGFNRFIAEVKTGKVAPDPTSTATRRQLFEYAHVFDADGLLLIDMEKREIREVRFSRRGRFKRLLLAIGLLSAGAIAEHVFHLIPALR